VRNFISDKEVLATRRPAFVAAWAFVLTRAFVAARAFALLITFRLFEQCFTAKAEFTVGLNF
jgi:hypothetical protein